jgi:hypothetical protein
MRSMAHARAYVSVLARMGSAVTVSTYVSMCVH